MRTYLFLETIKHRTNNSNPQTLKKQKEKEKEARLPESPRQAEEQACRLLPCPFAFISLLALALTPNWTREHMGDSPEYKFWKPKDQRRSYYYREAAGNLIWLVMVKGVFKNVKTTG